MSESPSGDGVGTDAPTLADKLNRLFEAAHRSGQRPPTNRAVAEGVTAAGTPISESFIHYLRSGARDNPTKKHLEGIARYFGIPASYFFDDHDESRRLYEELELVTAMRDADVRNLALRTLQMRPEMRRWLIDMLNGLAQAQDSSDRPDPGTDAGDR